MPGLSVIGLNLWILIAAPQAGGGGGFGGGGGGGGGGLDGDIIAFILWLVIEVPVIGIPVAILAFVAFLYMSRNGMDRFKGGYVQKHRHRRLKNRAAAATTSLQGFEPGFDPTRFLSRVSIAFHKAQVSWCKQDLRPVRPFVSDGIYERFSLQIAGQREEGWRQGMSETQITHSAITHHDISHHFDSLTVQIEFTANIDRRSLKDNEMVPGSALPWSMFSECWTFLRRRGAKPLSGAGLIEGNCPNCGVNVEMNQSARCESCQAVLRSGEYDWVLVEITQSSEYAHLRTEGLPGVESYREQDPGFSLQHLEDRASVIFWRKMAADRVGRSKPLAKVATAEFTEQYDRRREDTEDGSRRYTTDVAVGSVQLLGVLPGEEWDRVAVQVRWDGYSVKATASGEQTRSTKRFIRTSFLVLVRRAGVQTDLDRAIQSSHCSSCGAPEDDGIEPVCGFCGTVWNDGRSQWLLGEWIPAPTARSRALTDELRVVDGTPAPVAEDPESVSVRDLLHWTHRAASADGVIDDAENKVLRSLARRSGMTDGQLHALLESKIGGEEDAVGPTSPAEQKVWFQALVRHCLEDGRLSKAERRVLETTGSTIGYGRWDVKQRIRGATGDLFRESRPPKPGRR